MFPTRLIQRTLFRLLIAITVVLVAWNEFFVYALHKFVWNSIECQSDNCTRILLVADPQILGEDFDKSIFKWIEIADSDRYLEMTYSNVLQFSKPDIVCFLGDLLDEGSVASNEQYKRYADRFNYLFKIDSSVKYVHVPGDNDIGGENGEYISNSNVRRFAIEFEYNDIFDYKDRIRFLKINGMLMDFSNPEPQTNKDRLRIGVSHMPLLSAGGPILRTVIKDIDPHVIFSAHWHDSRILTYPSSHPGPSPFYERTVLKFDLDAMKMKHEYLEIGVPTVSYRMGKYKFGYGLAVIDDNRILRYTVLWTVSRFVFLGLYLAWIIIVFFMIICLNLKRRCLMKLCRRRNYTKISVIPDF